MNSIESRGFCSFANGNLVTAKVAGDDAVMRNDRIQSIEVQ